MERQLTTSQWTQGNEDLLTTGLWAILVLGVVSLPIVRGSFVRILVAGSFLMFVPGYALLAVLFPRVDQLSLLERFVFSAGASLAMVALLGIPLNQTQWGITLWSLLAEQFIVLLALSILTAVRRQRIPDSERTDPASELRTVLSQATDDLNMVGGGSRSLQVLIIVALIASVGATTYTVATPLPSETYTEFYVLGPNGTVDGVPSNASAGESIALTIGIDNHEHRSMTYRVQTRSETADGERLLRTTNVSIAPGDSQTWPIELQVPANASSVAFDLLLFRGKAPSDIVSPEEAYRSVRISIQIE